MSEEEKKELLKRFSGKLIRYYSALGGTVKSSLVVYHIEQILLNTLKELEKDNNYEY